MLSGVILLTTAVLPCSSSSSTREVCVFVFITEPGLKCAARKVVLFTQNSLQTHIVFLLCNKEKTLNIFRDARIISK